MNTVRDMAWTQKLFQLMVVGGFVVSVGYAEEASLAPDTAITVDTAIAVVTTTGSPVSAKIDKQSSVIDSAWDSTRSPAPGRNWWAAGALSAAIPGAGQIYDRRYIRGGLFFVSTSALALSARFWRSQMHWEQFQRDRYADSSRIYQNVMKVTMKVGEADTSFDTVLVGETFKMQYDSAAHEYRKDRSLFRQTTTWALGCWLYGVTDAIDKSGYFVAKGTRDPRKAALLSAIPCLGLGQIFNGKLGKAGMICMIQSGLGVMAYENMRLMDQADRRLAELQDTAKLAHRVAQRDVRFGVYWNNAHNDAFRDRNTYLWYSLFFYLYQICDAVVDAHLFDFQERMRLEPDLRPREKALGLTMHLNF